MKKLLSLLFITLLLAGCSQSVPQVGQNVKNEVKSEVQSELLGGTSVVMPNQGGTGSSQIPNNGELLVASTSGKYEPNGLMRVYPSNEQVQIGLNPTDYGLPNDNPNVSLVSLTDLDDYYAWNLGNISTGTSATADLVVYNNSTSSFVTLGMSGTNYSQSDLACFDPGAAYLYSNDTNFYVGTNGMTSTTGNTYIFAGGADDKANIRLVSTWDGKLGIGQNIDTNPPDSLFEARGQYGSLRQKDAGNAIIGDDLFFANVPTLAVNQPVGGYGANAKNIAIFTGHQSSTSSVFNNANIALIQLTPDIGNYLFYTFYNASYIDAGSFGVKFRDHGDKSTVKGDMVFATAYNNLPSTKLQLTGEGYAAMGYIQTDWASPIRHQPTHGLSIVDPNPEGVLTITGSSDALPTANSWVEFNFGYNGMGNNLGNLARIGSRALAGGGGDLVFQTAPAINGAYTDKAIITRAGNMGVGTSTPSSKFEVYIVSSTTGILANFYSDIQNIFQVMANGIVKIGSAINHTLFEADGTMTMNGNATVWEDLNFDPNRSGGPVATRPDEVVIGNNYYAEFTSANNQIAGSSEELPHEYKLSSTIYPHIHIFLKSGESAGTTGATFTLYWQLRQPTGTTTGTVALAATSAQLATTAGANNLNIYDSIGFTGPSAICTQLALTIARTGGDAGDVVVASYGVHYEADQIGSRTINSK